MEAAHHYDIHHLNGGPGEILLPTAAQVEGYAERSLTLEELDAVHLEVPETVIKLSEDEASAGFFWYIDQATKPGQSYPLEKGKYGAVQHVANNTGMSVQYISRAVSSGVTEKLLRLKKRDLGKNISRSDVILTRLGRQYTAHLQATQPRLIETAKEFMLQYKRQIVVWVRHEINRERTASEKKPYIFKGILALVEFGTLDEHLAWLRKEQADLMNQIDEA